VDVGVVGVLSGPNDRDEDGLRHPTRQEITEQLRLGLLERPDRRVSGEEVRGDVEDVLALPDE
jgi:hypothetical protein